MNTNNLPQPATPSADDLARTLAARQQAQAATAQTQASRAEGSSASAHQTKPTRTRPTKRRRKGLRNGIIAGATAITLALGGTTAWALNRYVIDHVEVTSASSYEASQGNAQTTSLNTDTATTTSDTYTNGNTKISVKQVQNNGVTYYVADVQLSDATALRSAFANDQFGSNITDFVSSIATDNNAVFAINGDYYGFRSTGIVIRNGTIYRDSGARQGLAIYKDGTMKVYDETQTTLRLWSMRGSGRHSPSVRPCWKTARSSAESTTWRSTLTSVTTPSRASSREPRSASSTTTTLSLSLWMDALAPLAA